ncbi:MAG: hypothetical protein PHV61_04050 [Limnochordia bacterium]|nr:hypothetical protein [Limnochordia bacterium]MDD2629326.1 hypothetical protein [Limnochordia bacterium]MDD4518069.1 hypothetical protein [Limnochordia bacterium]
MDRLKRPDIVYDGNRALEPKPHGTEAAAVKQAIQYVNKTNGGLILGDSQEFMVRTFGAPSHTLPSPITDNFGRMYKVTIDSHGSTPALTYRKDYIGRNEVYDQVAVTSAALAIIYPVPATAPVLVPALAQ